MFIEQIAISNSKLNHNLEKKGESMENWLE